MVLGEGVQSAIFWIPAKLAYGDAPVQIGAPVGRLRADVTVLEVLR